LLVSQGLCVSPPPAAAGFSDSYGGACTGENLLNAFGTCIASLVTGATTTSTFICPGTQLLNAQALCVDPQCVTG